MEPCPFSIVSYHRLPERNLLDKLCQTLLDRGFVLEEDNPELIIVFGGDGSFLKAVHDHDGKGKYVLINTGHLGFFSDYSLEEIPEFLQDVLEKDPSIESLPFLSYLSQREESLALSDVVVQADKTVDISVYLNDRLLCETKASGIVIGTPVASTAYLGSLGSPAIINATDVYQYALIAPVRNSLYLNPVDKAVLSRDDVLEIEVSGGKAALYLDGIRKTEAISETFRVGFLSSRRLKLAHFRENDNFRRILRSVSGIKEE